MNLLWAVMSAMIAQGVNDDLARFPNHVDVRQAMYFNRAFRSNLEAKRALFPSSYWEGGEAITKAIANYRAWDALDDAWLCQSEDVMGRARQLMRLRRLIGVDAYARGVMPPPVPLHLFRPID